VQDDVGVAVADQSARMLDADAAKDQRPTCREAVGVVPDPDAVCNARRHHGGNHPGCSGASASAEASPAGL
jgi:hypothetical protein